VSRDDLWSGGLGDALIRAWFCPVRSHRTVEWRGDVAHCTHGTCQLTSEDTRPWLQDIAEAIAKAEAERDAARAELARPLGHDHICGEILTANDDLGEALTLERAETAHLRAEVAALLPYAWAGAEALDFREPYGPQGEAVRDEAAGVLARIKAGEFGPIGDPS